MANERRRRNAKKREGGRTILSLDLDFADADRRYLVEPSTDVTPERLYEQRWALTLLGKVLSDLRKEFEEPDAADRYEVFEEFLPGGRHQLTHQQAADRLGISVGAAKIAVHRLRERYRRRFRDTVADTVERPEDVDGEVRHIFAVLGG